MEDVRKTKEVYFHQWCRTCQFKDKNEHDDPCDECLGHPYNYDSHKPVGYKEDEG